MKYALLGIVFVAACGDDGGNRHLADAPPAVSTLEISPPDATLTVVDGAAVTQGYTATLIEPDGDRIDVTAEATFAIAPMYGAFTGATVSVSGQGAGPTPVTATFQDLSGTAMLTVYVRASVVDKSAPQGAPGLFGAATEDPGRAPTIAYPSDGILVPPNLGQFDVHWSEATVHNDLFEVGLANAYVDIRLYTTGLDNAQAYWTVFEPQTWYPIASTRSRLRLTVSGLDTSAPATKGTTVAQSVDVTNEDTRGGIYYWSTTTSSVWRYDVGRPDVPPTAFFDSSNSPSSCMGCHNLSRDGSKLAITLDSGNGRGAVFDVVTKEMLLPSSTATETPYWNFASFDAAGTKLVTAETNGTLLLRSLAGDTLAGPLPTANAAALSTHPEISPDDTRLVSVEYTSGYASYDAQDGTIVIRDYNAGANTFGTPTALVPSDLNNAISNWYPSFSPDGQWIVFTRSSSGSYDASTAETWVVRADGTQAPIPLSAANTPAGSLTNSWARWVPFGQTFSATNEPMFYLTFSSKRKFGVRIPYDGQPQIWMVPFFPNRAAMGLDPSGPAFRVPFQDVATSNHIAQWTQSIIQ